MRVRRAALLSAVLALAASLATASDPDRVRQAGAALRLAELGLETGNIDALLVAGDLMASLSPTDPDGLLQELEVEIRLLARGDPVLLDRIDAMAARRTTSDPGVMILRADPILMFPENVAAIAAPGLGSVTHESEAVCARTAPAVWRCDPPLAEGPVALQVRARPAAIVIFRDDAR